jgi:uncharacterized ion transporter superfamily protein YfcC
MKMDAKKLDRLEDKVDKIQESLASIDKTLAVNTESLIVHIKRTNILEANLKPVEKHVERVNGIVKFLLFLGGTAGLIKLIGWH